MQHEGSVWRRVSAKGADCLTFEQERLFVEPSGDEACAVLRSSVGTGRNASRRFRRTASVAFERNRRTTESMGVRRGCRARFNTGTPGQHMVSKDRGGFS